jgi:hypothetical protein
MVQIADLVANFRATGLDDISRGAQQTREQLRGVAAEAQATSAQLDELARRAAAANPGAGSQQSFRTAIERQGLSYANAAELLGGVAKNAEQAATSVQKIAQPTQAVAKAASDLHDGFRLSESSIVRFGASLVGVGLGISLVAGAGRVLHDVIAGAVEQQVEWERSLVRIRALYGQTGDQVVAIARAQAAAPGVLGSPQEFVDANLNAAFLSRRYGVSPATVTGLTTAVGRASYVLNLPEQQRRDLQARAAAAAEGGGNALRDFGIELDPESVARQLGLSSAAGLQALTPQQRANAQALLITQGMQRLALQGSAEQPGLLSRQRDLEQAAIQARANVQRSAEQGFGMFGNQDVGITELGQPYLRATGEQINQADYLERLNAKLAEADRAVAANAAAITSETDAIKRSTDELARMGVTAGSAAARLLTFTGSLEDPLSIARGDIGAQAQAAVAARARSAIPGIGTPAAERAFGAGQDAYASAYQNYNARIAQQNTENADREFLQSRAADEARNLTDRQIDRGALTPAGRALQEAERTRPVYDQMRASQQTAQQLDMQAAEQQSRIEAITLQQRERNLRMLQDTVELRREDVNLQMHGVEANQALIRAQQAAQGPQNALEAAQYQTTRASVLAQARMARLLQGKDVSGLPSFDDLIAMNIQGQFAAAEAGPAALEAGRGVQVAGQAVTTASLAQQFTQSQVQLAELAVDLQNLGELPGQTALELELLQTNRDQLDVSREQRDLTRRLVAIMGGSAGASNGVTAQQISEGLAATSNAMAPASSGLAGARR